MNKKLVIDYLIDKNKKAIASGNIQEVVTRLFYLNKDGKYDNVEDFSYFSNPNYMSAELLESLKNGKSLSDELEREKEYLIKEMILA